MSAAITLPILSGKQASYDALTPNPGYIYICDDTGNIYLGSVSLGKDVLFYEGELPIPEDFGKLGQRCITPSGIFQRVYSETTPWQRWSRWSISEDGALQIDGKTPLASDTIPGFVKGSIEGEGKIEVHEDGTMSVIGWEDLKAGLNYIRRNE